MDFLFAQSSYHGEFRPQTLVFNANLQEFAQRVSYTAGLHGNGKISSEEAYCKIKESWKALQASYRQIESR